MLQTHTPSLSMTRGASLPTVGFWSERDPGLTVGGRAQLALTNISPIEVTARFDGRDHRLAAFELLTLSMDPSKSYNIDLRQPPGGGASGYFVQYDKQLDWQLQGGQEEPTRVPFSGPRNLTLVNHPKSDFDVEVRADGFFSPLERGVAANFYFSDAQLRSLSLYASPEGSARGLFCLVSD